MIPRPLERRYVSDVERASVRRRRGLLLLTLAACVAVAAVFDRAAYGLLVAQDTARLESRDWYQVARQVGYLPVWALIAAWLWLVDGERAWRASGAVAVLAWPPRPRHHRAGLVLLAAAVPGALSDLVKYLAGRSRPLSPGQAAELAAQTGQRVEPGSMRWGGGIWSDLGLTEGFPPLSEGLGLGFFSGHTATAVGGMVMLGLLFPAARWLAWALAAACGLSRMAAGAHSLSDVVAAAGAGGLIAWAFYAAGEGVRRRRGLGAASRYGAAA